MLALSPDKPFSLTDPQFHENKYETYSWLRKNSPLHVGKVSVLKVFMFSRYEDCMTVMRDTDQFVRNRGTVTGGSKLPFPLPKSISVVAESMIIEDDPEHKRLRSLVQQAFAPKNVRNLEERIRVYAHEILDNAGDELDLKNDYALPIPMRVIGEIVGISGEDLPQFKNAIRTLSDGMTGWNVLRTLVFDMPAAIKFVRALIERKRNNPGDDVLTGLIEAEEDGDRLTENELISMVFLLIIAGFETTVNLVTNSVVALQRHPDQLQRLHDDPSLWGSAVEELLRYNGPVHGTKMNYARHDIEMHGVTIPKGSSVVPLIGAANRDPDVFADPDTLDITRSPNRHLGFSQGAHFCLGAFLARMEARVALSVLYERAPDLEIMRPEPELEFERLPLWHRYVEVPIKVR